MLNKAVVSVRSTHMTETMNRPLETVCFLNGFSMLCF